MAAERQTAGLDLGFIARFYEALYGLHAYHGRDRIPGMTALVQLHTENSELFTLLTTQVVEESRQLITTARSLGVSLGDELRIREMGYRVLSGIPELHLKRRTPENIRRERYEKGLTEEGRPNSKLTEFLTLFGGSSLV
jgi:hypothetical protein